MRFLSSWDAWIASIYKPAPFIQGKSVPRTKEGLNTFLGIQNIREGEEMSKERTCQEYVELYEEALWEIQDKALDGASTGKDNSGLLAEIFAIAFLSLHEEPNRDGDEAPR